MLNFFNLDVYAFKLLACKNEIPSSCSFPSCDGAFNNGFCQIDWNLLCDDDNVPGKVKDSCHKECGLCSGEFVHL